jgi:hypothetical protein
MEAVKEAAKVAGSINVMQVIVRGRIEASRTYEGKRYTHIMTPAADAYSRPQLVEVRSKARLGEKGDEVTVVCVLGGFSRKPYEAKDKSTGEVVKITPVDHTLDVVERD